MVGIFTSTDFRKILFAPEIEYLVIVKDIAIADFLFATPTEDLNSILQKFTIKNIDNLPVVEDHDHRKLLGMLTRRDIIAFYNRQLQRLRGKKAV